MSPVVRIAKFALSGFILFILMMCAAWLAIIAYILVAYGPLESLAFALGSASLIAIIYGMKRHGHHRYDHGCDRR